MGKIDEAAKPFFSNPQRFADIWNFYLYGGQEIIQTHELEDYGGQTLRYKRKNNNGGTTTYRTEPDCMKKWRGIGLRLLIHEYQSYIDYRMVFRNMMTEAIGYHEQWKDKRSGHKRKKDLRSVDEYMSGMLKDEKFMPIITLVINLSEKPWDGPRSLHEMIEEPDDEIIKSMVTDYKLNLFDYHDYEDFGAFRTTLKQVFEILRSLDDRDRLSKLLSDDTGRYKNLGAEAAELIEALTDIRIPAESTEEGGNRNMYKALEEQRALDLAEGRKEGRAEAIRSMITKLKLTAEQAMDVLSIPEDERMVYLSKL